MIKRILKGMRKESKVCNEISEVCNEISEVCNEISEGKEPGKFNGARQAEGVKGTPLSLIKPGANAKISRLETKDLKVLQKLMAMGILPGMPVTLIRKSPTYVLELDQTRYAVDRDIASHIYVSC